MAEFDTIAKHLIQTYPRDFARFALQQDDVEVVEVIDTEQPTVEAHRTDSLIRVQINGEEALVHHEFQTTDSTDPPEIIYLVPPTPLFRNRLREFGGAWWGKTTQGGILRVGPGFSPNYGRIGGEICLS